MLTATDLQNTIVFLKRTNLTGEESMAHAELLIKFSQMLQEAQQPPPATDPVIDPPPPGETPIDEAIEGEGKH